MESMEITYEHIKKEQYVSTKECSIHARRRDMEVKYHTLGYRQVIDIPRFFIIREN